MPAQQKKYAFVGAAMLILLLMASPLVRSVQRRGGPEMLEDAAEIAGAQGLYCASDSVGGFLSTRLVVSETPLSWHRAARTVLDPKHPSMAGTVAVYYKRPGMVECNYDPSCSAVWGELFVFGDPRLIHKLTGVLPEGAPPSIER